MNIRSHIICCILIDILFVAPRLAWADATNTEAYIKLTDEIRNIIERNQTNFDSVRSIHGTVRSVGTSFFAGKGSRAMEQTEEIWYDGSHFRRDIVDSKFIGQETKPLLLEEDGSGGKIMFEPPPVGNVEIESIESKMVYLPVTQTVAILPPKWDDRGNRRTNKFLNYQSISGRTLKEIVLRCAEKDYYFTVKSETIDGDDCLLLECDFADLEIVRKIWIVPSKGYCIKKMQLQQKAIVYDEYITTLKEYSPGIWWFDSVTAKAAGGPNGELFERTMEISVNSLALNEPIDSETFTLAGTDIPPGTKVMDQITGLIVELLGLTYIPVKNQPWWRPDGSALQPPLFDHVSYTPSVDPNWQQFAHYAMPIKLHGKGPDKVGLIKWDFTDALYAGTTSAYLGDKSVYPRNIHTAAAKFPKDVETTTLQLGIASDEWQTLFAGRHYGFYEKGKDALRVSTLERAGGPGAVRPGERGTHIDVTYNITDRDFRVVAVDKDGKLHLSSRGGWSGTENLHRTTASFPHLTHHHLKEFRFQVRGYEWIEFNDISLRPGKEAVALAERQTAKKQEQLEKWLGQGQTRRIREHILILRDSRLSHINEPCVPQVKAISAMQELVRIGSPAVPELITELRRAENWMTKSLVAFVLRAIGHPQVVPALIEELGQAKYRGEYGIHVKDDQRAKFMLDNQHCPPDESDRRAKAIRLGCPVIEITVALEKITGHTEGHEHYGHKATAELGRDAPHEQWQQRVQEIVEEVADRWQNWWEDNIND